jgi:hypothetical protein
MAADLVDIELAEGEREVKDQGVVTTRANLDKGFAESFVETMALGRDWSRMQKVLVPA